MRHAGRRCASGSRASRSALRHDGAYNIWSQPLDATPPTQITELKGEEIFSYDWSPDFRLLACERGVEISDVVMIGGR